MSVNKVILVGNLGQDVELKYGQSGTAVGNFSLATTEKWKDKSGQQQEKTEWHKVVTFGKTAENCAKYLAKGRKVYVEGKLQTDSYEKDGITRYTTKIIADQVQFLDSSSGGAPAGPQGGYKPPAPPQQQYQGGGYAPAPQSQIPEEDNIPF